MPISISIYNSIHISLSVYIFIYIYRTLYVSIYIPISINLSIYLSIRIYLHTSSSETEDVVSLCPSLTREFGLSSTTKMMKTLAPRAARTAAITRSFPSRKRPRPSDTTSSSWAVSAGGRVKGQRMEKRKTPHRKWIPHLALQQQQNKTQSSGFNSFT